MVCPTPHERRCQRLAPASPLLVPDPLRPGSSASRLPAAPSASGGEASLNPLGNGEGSVAMQRSRICEIKRDAGHCPVKRDPQISDTMPRHA